MSNGIFLLLGSNEGDPARNLETARQRIAADAARVAVCSSLYKSAAWGMEQQADFLNQVIQVESFLSPDNLLKELLRIEQQMGRIRSTKWGPRLIDIDLLFYGSEIISTPALTVPHPGIPERRFTLEPLAEIAPDFLHPVLNKTVAALLRDCNDTLSVQRLPAAPAC